MDSTTREGLNLSGEDLEILAELLESERTKLLVEIRHTDHRRFRDDLPDRLAKVEGLLDRCREM